jgi:PIN domain nuclease of toxin-antitoxin system
MKYLIDTHAFLWFNDGSNELSNQACKMIENNDNDIYISIASLWEISIKSALGKLSISGDFETVIDDVEACKIKILPITFPHITVQHKLPLIHKDPFDRIIISQAIFEGLNIISRDEIFDQYLIEKNISRIW